VKLSYAESKILNIQVEYRVGGQQIFQLDLASLMVEEPALSV